MRPLTLVLLSVLALTLLRIFILYDGWFDFYGDEAQYWGWAQRLAFGYYSKPPMVAWAIWLTSSVCGEAEWCARLASPLAHGATALALYVLGKELFNERIGAFAALMYLTLPAATLSATMITTDPFLLLFWSLTLLAFVKAERTGEWKWWILLGIFGGLGVLTKYSMLFFGMSLLLYLISKGEALRNFKNPKFWTAAAIGLALYLPNFFWNLRHGFATYLHTKDNANLGHDWVNPEEMLAFLGEQIGVIGPILFGLFCWRLFKLREDWRHPELRLLICFTLVFLGAITVVSFLSRAHGNWAAPSYVAAMVWLAATAAQKGKEKWLKAAIAFHLFIACAFYFYDPMIRALGLQTVYKQRGIDNLIQGNLQDPFRRLRGWKEVGAQVSELLKKHPDAVLLTFDRKLTAELLYYVHPHPFRQIVKWNPDGRTQDHYELMTHIQGAIGRELLLIVDEKQAPHILKRFVYHERLEDIAVPTHPDFTRRYQVYLLSGFEGYE